MNWKYLTLSTLALVARIDGDVVLLAIDATTGELRHRTALN